MRRESAVMGWVRCAGVVARLTVVVAAVYAVVAAIAWGVVTVTVEVLR